ncbi:esterase FE4-like [Chrysoperla carnea]|uniref:esterase FE4-like n=1 Tax=Chrysoperla carnea TaxID=189513 RepID=UPI001D062968|nr:esterase FE4-like [Chrysoperla carnea]
MKEINWKTKIHIEQGDLCGEILSSSEGFDYYSYKGIPYAKPPVLDLRFQAPVEPEPWTGIFNATEHGNRSVSISLATYDTVGSEDCLYLNVYTRELPNPDTKLKAVMFWIHGGGFWSGSGDTDFHSPDFLLTEDVVLVTINYRLAFEGFLTVNDPEKAKVCQNIGIRDMIMALKWVKKNIAAFNGDPNNVTIFGESYGSLAAHVLICSPLARGLFHKAICQSGTSLISYDERAYIRNMPQFIAELLGEKFDNEEEAVEYIKSVPAETIIKTGNVLSQYCIGKYERLFGPVIEKSNEFHDAVLPDDPEILLKRGDFNKVPLLIGTNSHDGMLYTTKLYLHRLIPPNILDSQSLVPRFLELKHDTHESIKVGNRILKFYYGLETPSMRNVEKYNKYHTDINFNYQTKKAVKYHLKHKAGPVYLYKFSFDSRCNLYKKIFDVNSPGAGHGDELTYLFSTKYHEKLRFGINERNTMLRLVTYWTNFAKYGNPNPIEPDPLFKTEWKPVQENVYNHQNIGKTIRHYNEQPDDKTMQFWDQLFKEYGHEF